MLHPDLTSGRFGDLLPSRSLVNGHDLALAVEHGERRNVPLVEAVVDLGFVSETDSYTALANAAGLRLVELSELTPSNLALIRQNVALATLTIMILTAEDGPGIEERVLELGADDYVVKPFEAPVLISRVRAAFRRIHRMAA